MAQKHRLRTSTRNGGRGATRYASAGGGRSVWCCASHRATLGRAGPGTTFGSGRLERAPANSETHQAYRSDHRATGVDDSAMVEGSQCTRRVRCCCDPTRDGSPRSPCLSVDSHHRANSRTSRGTRRPQAPAPAGPAAKLVPSRRGGREGRIGQLRYHRRSGDPRRAAFGRFYWGFAAWGLGGGLAGTLCICQEYTGCSAGTLAGSGTACLRPIRQRQPLHGSPSACRCRWPRDPHVLEPGRDSRVRCAYRTRIPGSHRKPQRPLAGQSVVPIRTSLPARSENPIDQVHRRRSKPSCRADRIGTLAAPVSQTMAIEPAKTSARQDHLHPTHQRQGSRQPAGTHLHRRSALASPPRPRRGRSQRKSTLLLRPAKTRTDRSTAPERGSVYPPPETIQRMTPMY